MRLKSLNTSTFLFNAKYRMLSPADKISYITYFTGLIISICLSIIDTFFNYSNTRIVSASVIVAFIISIYLHFSLNKPFISNLIIVTSLNVASFYLCITLGLTTSYFLYAYAILCSIPLTNKRDNNYLRNCIILSVITLLSALLSIILSPQYNHQNLLADGANQKLVINSVLGFILFMVFAFVLVIVSSNIITVLIESKKNAEKQKDSKTRVLSNLGHELRTQISGIHGITQLLLEQNGLDELSNNTFSHYTETLEVCSNQMLFLVNDVLDIHKIESGNFTLYKKPENLTQLLNQVIIPFKSITKDKSIAFIVYIDPNLKNYNVSIDASRLTQVLQNLISNAIKYTYKGFVRFSIRIESQTKKHAIVSFTIKDSGIGISESSLSKIFDSFQQIRNEDTAYIGGTGLGLAISKTIVETMDSHINVVSKLDEGSTFSFTLKLLKTTNKLEPKQNIEVDKPIAKVLQGKKILIAEDNKISMLYASKLLEKNGAKVLKAYNGLQAVKIAKVHLDISVILLDLEMPEMNGFTAIKHIKKVNNEVKIIAFTANIPDENLHHRLNKLNFDDFLAKPYKNDDIYSVLIKHIEP